MHQFVKFLLMFSIISYISCKNKIQNTIDVELIKKIFVDSNYQNTTLNSTDFDFEFINDTILTNNKNERIEDALKEITDKYLLIDTLKTNLETKQYTKSLLLAEWIYANFNYQFLGPRLGLADTLQSGINFKSTNPNTCYQAGNSNLMAVWCGDRSNLFVRLIDSLLKLPTAVISIERIHTFPIVKIAGKNYIIDPYDPFVLFDEQLKHIVDYEVFKINPDSINTKAIRTSRNFGNAGELVSKQLYELMQKKYGGKNYDIGKMIESYLKTNRSFLSTFNDTCKSEPFIMKRKVLPVLSKTNAFVLYSPKNALPHEIKKTRIHKYYLGIDCKIKK